MNELAMFEQVTTPDSVYDAPEYFDGHIAANVISEIRKIAAMLGEDAPSSWSVMLTVADISKAVKHHTEDLSGYADHWFTVTRSGKNVGVMLMLQTQSEFSVIEYNVTLPNTSWAEVLGIEE